MASEEPTRDDVLEIRQDIVNYVVDTKDLEADYIPQALAHIKRFLENKRGVFWITVWDVDNSDYFIGSDGIERNRDKIINAISHMTVALVFKDWSLTNREGQWWDLYLAYRSDAEDSLRDALLDIDKDKSGSISDSETAQRTQPFVIR